MEDCFVLAQRGELTLHRKQIDALLQGVDLLTRIAHPPGNDETWGDHAGKPEITAFIARLTKAMSGSGSVRRTRDYNPAGLFSCPC